jgi:hypothetical protein
MDRQRQAVVDRTPPRTDGAADRARALILLRATLATVAERLDEDSLEDLGLLTRMSELSDLVDQDLQRLADTRKP